MKGDTEREHQQLREAECIVVLILAKLFFMTKLNETPTIGHVTKKCHMTDVSCMTESDDMQETSNDVKNLKTDVQFMYSSYTVLPEKEFFL